MHKVLLVLDSEDLATILHNDLSKYFDIIICDAATATDTINLYQPDALILDLFLPGTDGFQVLQHTHYSIPSIILVTVLVSTDILNRAANLNINYIFLKPFKQAALTKRLHELLHIDIN